MWEPDRHCLRKRLDCADVQVLRPPTHHTLCACQSVLPGRTATEQRPAKKNAAWRYCNRSTHAACCLPSPSSPGSAVNPGGFELFCFTAILVVGCACQS